MRSPPSCARRTGIRSLRLAASFATLAVVGACGDGGEPAGTPSRVVARVVVSPPSATVAVGQGQRFTAEARNADDDIVPGVSFAWRTSAPTVATVEGGLASGLGAGTASIVAAVGTIEGAATLTVTPVPVATVEITPRDTTLVTGETAQLVATAKDAAGRTLAGRAVAWSSSRPEVATVDADGRVSTRVEGATTVRATIDGASGAVEVRAVGRRGAADLRVNCLPVDLRVPRGSTSTISCDVTMPATLGGRVALAGGAFPAGVRLHPVGADSTQPLPAGATVTVFLAVDVDAAVAPGRYDGRLLATIGGEARSVPLDVEVTTARAVVRMVYLVPSDRTYDPLVAWGMERAVRHLQIFHQQELGAAGTFAIHLPVVEVVHSLRPASHFAANAFNGVADVVFAALGGRYYDPANIWVVYFDVIPTSAVGGNASLATLPRNDLLGITGRSPAAPIRRWIGGLGHEVGHAMGLPHPPGCEQGSTSADCGSLMYLGYLDYPRTVIAPSQKAGYAASGYVTPGVTTTPVLFDADVLGPPLVVAPGAPRAAGAAAVSRRLRAP